MCELPMRGFIVLSLALGLLLGLAVAEEECPDKGLFAHGRCWYLSAKGANCATACFVHGLNFSWYVPRPDAPILPRLLGSEPQQHSAWGRVECLRTDIDGYHAARRVADPTSGDTTAEPNLWSTLRCQMVCPCARGSARGRRGVDSSPVCGLGFQQRVGCCLDDVTDCWHGWSWVSLKAHRRCCGAEADGECPFFGEPVRLSPLHEGSSQPGVEVCLHRPEIAHDVIEDKIRKLRAPYDCELLHRLAALMVRQEGGRRLQVVDVGANVGACSLAVADLGADVVAVEANPRVFALLNTSAHRYTKMRNGASGRITALNYAASDEVGLGIILEPRGNAGGSSTLTQDLARTVIYDGVTLITSSTDGPGGLTQEVTQRNWPVEEQRLDQALPKVGVNHVDLLKIDAEGDEFKVLRGIGGLLADRVHAPQVIKFEFHPMRLEAKREDPVQMLHWLLRHGYTLFLLKAVSAASLAKSCRISSLAAATEVCRNFATRVLDIMTDVVAISDRALHGGAFSSELISPSTGQAPPPCPGGT